MKTVIHKAETRGESRTSWLESRHSFSFNNYYDPKRMGFGTLRVLNDDRIAPAQGFGTHPHKDMEIVSIVLKGSLEHKDSTGGKGVLEQGDVQVMTAGTGIFHSEYNPSQNETGEFFQIWIEPSQKSLKPRYEQRHLGMPEGVQEIVTNIDGQDDARGALGIHQDAAVRLGTLARGKSIECLLAPGHGTYAFLIDGKARIAGKELGPRDAIGVSETEKYRVTALTDATLLIIDVTMR